MRFATIAGVSRLPHARVLARNIEQHYPGARLEVLTLAHDSITEPGEPFDVIRPEQLGVAGWEEMIADARWADATEFFKPHVLSRMIGEGAEIAVYLDAAVDLYDRLTPLDLALEHNGAAITPRLQGALPVDRKHPDNADLREAGRHGASLVALTRAPVSVRLVGWWAERLTHGSESLPIRLDDSDQGHACRELNYWIDLAPSVFDEIKVLDDPGLAVSYWNLHERTLRRRDSEILIDDHPLRYMHFDGFDPGRPFLLGPTAEADRVRTSATPVLAELCDSYASRVIDAGWRDYRRRSDVGRSLPNGMTFDDRLSTLLAKAAAGGRQFGDIFTQQGTEEFMKWLEEPAVHGGGSQVNRFLYAIYSERDDLQGVYPDLDGFDAGGFAGWAWTFGIPEMDIPERFLPPRPDGVDAGTRTTRAVAGRTRPSMPHGKRPSISMNVTGMLTGTLGLGEAARSYVRALQAADVPVSTTTVNIEEFVELDDVAHVDYARVDYEELATGSTDGFNLICINADELPRFAAIAGDKLFERPSIGIWAWETDHVPERWNGAYNYLDEIWVYSDYVAENLGRVAPIPVRRMPPAVLPNEQTSAGIDLELGVPAGFQFLFMFDFFSTIQRKNPVGLIKAFRQAFEPGEGPQLVVKTINGVHRPDALEEVLWAARGRDDIHVIDRSLSAAERDALVAGCDCYASLHRSEGFGLTLTECMMMGKPVIATDFSGTTDFMKPDNSYLVPYEMTRVGADCEIYPAEGNWAEPDIGEAAKLMRRVVEQPDEAKQKGERAKAFIDENYSPQAVGALMRARLEEIAGLWPANGARTASPAVSENAV